MTFGSHDYRFSVGDRVLIVDTSNSPYGHNVHMDKLIGTYTTISKLYTGSGGDAAYRILEDDGMWHWHDSNFEYADEPDFQTENLSKILDFIKR